MYILRDPVPYWYAHCLLQEIAKAVVSRGHSVDPRSSSGETPLLGAVKKQHLEMATQLLDAGADANAERHTKISSIHIAAGRQQLPMLELLLSRGANIEASNNDGQLIDVDSQQHPSSGCVL